MFLCNGGDTVEGCAILERCACILLGFRRHRRMGDFVKERRSSPRKYDRCSFQLGPNVTESSALQKGLTTPRTEELLLSDPSPRDH